MKMTHLNDDQVMQKLKNQHYSAQSTYKAYFSTWLGGVTTNPSLMVLPMDDHLVHRGDGVFEAIKVVNHNIYLLHPHIDRLFYSAEQIGIQSPLSKADLIQVICETLKISQSENAVLRLFLSRGPGLYSTNPADSIGAQIYLCVTELKPLPQEKFEKGVRIGRSQIPVKNDWLAKIKTCNYLPNVMMKKESVERGLDFTVAFDDQGLLAESSTENIFIHTKENKLVHPGFDRILKGTTMSRLFDLVEERKLLPVLRGVKIEENDLLQAQGLFMAGTTLDILPVCEYEGKKVPISPMAKVFLEMIREDQKMANSHNLDYRKG